jgi:predicted PurR-regulated permease PerM
VVLGLWVALWDLVPLVGFFIGSIPIVVLASVQDGQRGVVVALVVVAYQLLEAFVLQRRVERTSIHLGPFLTVAGGLLGLELYGLGGVLLAVALLAALVAVAEVVEERREAASQPRS